MPNNPKLPYPGWVLNQNFHTNPKIKFYRVTYTSNPQNAYNALYVPLIPITLFIDSTPNLYHF